MSCDAAGIEVYAHFKLTRRHQEKDKQASLSTYIHAYIDLPLRYSNRFRQIDTN